MKFTICLTLFLLSFGTAQAQETSDIKLSQPKSTESDFSQLFTIQGGAFSANSISVSNGDYKFTYDGDSLKSYVFEAGWALKLFQLLGAFQVEENLDFTGLQGEAPSNIRGVDQTQNLKLYLLGLDTRIMYSMEWFPWKRLIPFIDGGYRYTFFSQSGPSDLESAQGVVGNAVAGAGLRFWVNRGTFTGDDLTRRFTSIPIFLTAKFNRTFSSGEELDLAGDSYLFGLAVAL
jgi:hypothetical protein